MREDDCSCVRKVAGFKTANCIVKNVCFVLLTQLVELVKAGDYLVGTIGVAAKKKLNSE